VALAARSRITRSASAPSGTFSTKVVLTCAQRGLDGLAALVVLARPAGLGDGRDIDEAGLDGLTGGWLGSAKKREGEKTGGRERGSEVFVHGVPLHGPGD
jgi:hypothetical protein